MTAPGPAAKTFRLDGSYAAINRLYQERGWTDGLPIVPPTDDDVRECLRFTDRDPRDVVAVLPPRQGEATVERIAVNAVMAGCRPEYLPVIITAIEALADPAFNLDSIQATTHPVAPLMIVNGPIARELRIKNLPTMVLVSTEGKVLFNGDPSDDEFWTALKKIDAGIVRPDAVKTDDGGGGE